MTVKQALNPLFLLGSVFGLGIHFHTKAYLNMFYNISIWIGYYLLLYFILITLRLSERLSDLDSITLGCNCVNCTTSITLSIYNYKRFQICLKRLTVVNYTLARLDIPKTHEKLHAYVKGMIVVWFLFFIGSLCDTGLWIEVLNIRWAIIVSFATNHVYHINTIVDILFCTLLWYIGTRFDEVNEHLQCLIQETPILRHTRRIFAQNGRRHVTCADDYKHVLWTAMHLHLELCQVARELNALFGTQITLETISSLAATATILSFEVMHLLTINDQFWTISHRISTYFWSVVFISKMFYLNYTCETVSAKAKKIEKIVLHVTNPLLYDDVRDEIHQFILQGRYHPLKFTGLGLFEFGYSFLQRFVTCNVALVLFVVQSKEELISYQKS